MLNDSTFERLANAIRKNENVSLLNGSIKIDFAGFTVIISNNYCTKYNIDISFPAESTIGSVSLFARYFCAISLYDYGFTCSSFNNSILGLTMLSSKISTPVNCWTFQDSTVNQFITDISKLSSNDIEYMMFRIVEVDRSFALSFSARLCTTDVYDAIAKLKCDPLSFKELPVSPINSSSRIWKISCYNTLINYYAKSLIG